MVFIHGAGGSISTWKRQIPFFKNYFNLLLLDLRDHGASKNISPAFGSYNFEIISTDIKLVLDQHHISQAHFITLSFGSVLIQDFVSRYPEYIDKLVFTGAVLGGGRTLRSFVYAAKFLNLFLPYPTMYRLFSFLLMPKKENQFARRLYLTQAKKLTQQEYLKWLGLYKEFFQLLRSFSLQQLAQPSLIIMGEQDFMFFSKALKFHRKQSRSQFHSIKNTRHIVNIEASRQFNDLVASFLKTA